MLSRRNCIKWFKKSTISIVTHKHSFYGLLQKSCSEGSNERDQERTYRRVQRRGFTSQNGNKIRNEEGEQSEATTEALSQFKSVLSQTDDTKNSTYK